MYFEVDAAPSNVDKDVIHYYWSKWVQIISEFCSIEMFLILL